MTKQQEAPPLLLKDLEDMCMNSPLNVSIAKKPALDTAATQFGLMTATDVKKFIADGLENVQHHGFSDSDTFADTKITEYKFTSGKKNGYLAFHKSQNRPDGIHIKSFHEDKTNPSLGTLGDIFKNLTLGDKNE